jgi:peptidoglycan/xylan/chitin deacetylase (PgdA/CDA1 family)
VLTATAMGLVAGLLLPLAAGSPAARAGEPAVPSPVPGVPQPAVATVVPAAAPRLVWHGPRTERVVALTFDDGWNPRTLRQIHRILLAEHVPATFFVTGIYVQRDPALWRRIAATGFALANHSYLHRDARRLTANQMARDLAETRRVVEAATGRPMLPAFRPPYGSRSSTTDLRAAAAGFPVIVMWDVSAGDTMRRPTVASVVRGAVAGRRGSIVLLHAGPRVTPRALPAIIARYRARGFRFVTLDELLGITAGAAGGRMFRDLDRARPDDDGGSPAVGVSIDPVEGAPGDRGDGPSDPGVISAQASLPAAVVDHAVAGPTGPAAPAVARDAAWARRAGTPGSVALFTAALLVALVLVAALAGRPGSAGDEDPPATGDDAA